MEDRFMAEYFYFARALSTGNTTACAKPQMPKPGYFDSKAHKLTSNTLHSCKPLSHRTSKSDAAEARNCLADVFFFSMRPASERANTIAPLSGFHKTMGNILIFMRIRLGKGSRDLNQLDSYIASGEERLSKNKY